MQTIEQALEKLKRSKFRARFYLNDNDMKYLEAKGMEVIESHARDFVRSKLAPAEPVNDGKQTPMRGHPVFAAMHGTACCCRGCLNKWYRVPMHRELTQTEQDKIVRLLMAWIGQEVKLRRTKQGDTGQETEKKEKRQK